MMREDDEGMASSDVPVLLTHRSPKWNSFPVDILSYLEVAVSDTRTE